MSLRHAKPQTSTAYAHLTRVEVNGITLTLLDYFAPHDLSFHNPKYPSVIMVCKGVYDVRACKDHFVIKQGASFCLQDVTNMPVEKSEKGLRLFTFQFNDEWCKQYEPDLPATGSFTIARNSRLHSYSVQLYKEFQHVSADTVPVMQKLLEIICILLKKEAQDKSKTEPACVEKLRTVCDALPECLPDAKVWARELGIAKRKLISWLKKYTGITYKNYQLKRKLRLAHNYLRDTKLSCSEISDLCGFSSDSYFNQEFKKEYGLCPEEYRATYF